MRRSLPILLLLWAAIYLPALGSLEIKGEEGRRILPAVTMLETGNYLVPQVGSEPYLRKPPLVNWLVAASFKLSGVRNEWSARFPSVLCVLAVALSFLFAGRKALGETGALFAACLWLTSFGIIEKGRLIEIEALYVSLFGLAIVCWLAFWLERRSPWALWIVPWIFLGLGLLAKGPLLLLFFYAIVVAVAFRSRRSSELLHPAHFVAVLIGVGIFAAWAIPCLRAVNAGHATQVWSRQFSGRLAGEGFHFQSWLLNIPHSLAYFLPWIVLCPLLRASAGEDGASAGSPPGLALGIALSFLLVNLVPGSLPRYVMPLLVPACWALASRLSNEQSAARGWFAHRWSSLRQRRRLVLGLSFVTAISLVAYALLIVPRLKSREKIRTIAAQIDASLPAGATLYALDPDYQPALFYLRRPIIYLNAPEQLPGAACFVLAPRKIEHALEANKSWNSRNPASLARVTDYRNVTIGLYRLPAAPAPVP